MGNKYNAGDIVMLIKGTYLYKYTFLRESEIAYASSLEPVYKAVKDTPAVYFEPAEGHPGFSKVLVDGICYAVYESYIWEGEKYVG